MSVAEVPDRTRTRPKVAGLWADLTPIRSELFGIERLEHHALSLAAAQPVRGGRPIPLASLARRVQDNADHLLAAYRFSGKALQGGQQITPAAEWLLDNFHIAEQQLRQVKADLPPGYYQQLPKLSDGPLAGYPRVFGIAWAFVAHSDSLVNAPALVRFIAAYQTVQPLRIGELWAVAITLRIVLIENMRRIAEQIVAGHKERLAADALVDQVLAYAVGKGPSATAALMALDGTDLSEIMAGQIAKRLRVVDPAETPLAGWMDERLRRQGTSVEAVVTAAQVRQGASNVTMRNIVGSMRRLSDIDWAEFFESVSLVDAELRGGSEYAAMDFATRNTYRTAIEVLARGSRHSETEVTAAALEHSAAGESAVSRDPGFYLIGDGSADLRRQLKFRPPVRMQLERLLRGSNLAGYLCAILLATVALLSVACALAGWTGVVPWLVGLSVALESAVSLVNLAVMHLLPPRTLPGLELKEGIPPGYRTLVVVPVLLANARDLQEQIEGLEVHHLSSVGGSVHYALLSDGPDADAETSPHDEALIAAAQTTVADLNTRYPGVDGDRDRKSVV